MDGEQPRRSDRANKGQPPHRYFDSDFGKNAGTATDKTTQPPVSSQAPDKRQPHSSKSAFVVSKSKMDNEHALITFSDDGELLEDVSEPSGLHASSNRSVRSEHSSTMSTSSSQRRRLRAQAELEAAAKLEQETLEKSTELQKKELEVKLEKAKLQRTGQIQKTLIEKRKEVRLAEIEEDDEGSLHDINSDSNSQTLSDDEDNVTLLQARRMQTWVKTGNSVRNQPQPHQAAEHGAMQRITAKPRDVGRQPTPEPEPDTCSPSLAQAILRIATSNEALVQSLVKTSATGSSAPRRDDAIAHRKTLGRDLPSFSGSPEEWPVFVASFRRTTVLCQFQDDENIARLQKALKGKAREVVGDLLAEPENVSRILKKLEKRFGQPEFVIEAALEKAKKMPAPKEGNVEALISFSDAVDNLVTRITALKKEEYLVNPQLLKELAEKLPFFIKTDWASHKEDLEGAVTLRTFSTWLERKTRGLATFVTAKSSTSDSKVEKRPDDRKTKDSSKRPPWKKETVLAVTDSSPKTCLHCNRTSHDITSCRKFAKLTTDDRWKFVSEHKLCFCCLADQHQIKQCERRVKCSAQDCGSFHHRLLHKNKAPPAPDKNETLTAASSTESEHTLTVKDSRSCVLLKILPVILKGPKGQIKTYAMLDCGSQKSFIQTSLAEELGLEGETSTTSYKLFGGASQSEKTKIVPLKVSGIKDKTTFDLTGVCTKDDLSLPMQSLNPQKLAAIWSHLKKVNVDELTNAQPTILIGSDHAELITGLRSIIGRKKSPVLTKTKLGWVLHGNATKLANSSTEFVSACFQDSTDSLHQLVKDSFQTETFGVRASQQPLQTKEDKRAIAIIEKTARQVGQKWEVGLLWKYDNFQFPDSKPMALRRLKSIERRMDRDPDFARRYSAEIEANIQKGYARKLNPDEAAIEGPRIWYLPHFVALNANKPDKFRVVFDAAAKANGLSLNDFLLTGPDLQNSLVGMLLKFRQNEIAIVADIKEFFPQIAIKEDDRQAQRFLWRGTDRNRDPDVYHFNVTIFGATCAPFACQVIRNKNGMLHQSEFPDATNAIVHKHYMDDYIDSLSTVEDAISLMQQVTAVHKRGGFKICNWLSNSCEFLNALPPDMRKQGGDDKPLGSSERILGLTWSPEDDAFKFTFKFHKVDPAVVNGTKTPTKRDVLKLVMSIYDPLGFVAHYTIKAKILLQDIWRSDLNWDDALTEPLAAKWFSWIADLPKLKGIRIPRCYSTNMRTAIGRQLHIFCDAGEQAFSSVAYIRVETQIGIDVAFVMARTRVAPLKPMSIPRLELQGAVMASRLADTIKYEHDLTFDRTVFWTDSKTVMSWITSEARKYKTFVAQRIGEIQESTKIEDWNWLPTKLNVADLATKDCHQLDFDSSSIWFAGPDFLCQPEDEWPNGKLNRATDNDEIEAELRPSFTATIVADDWLPGVSRFSSWLKLMRCTSWMLRFIRRCRDKTQLLAPELTPTELELSERVWIRQCQWQSFASEMTTLTAKKPLPAKSRLFALKPFIDETGIMRIDGRLRLALELPYETKCPAILDPKNPYTRLLIQYYHDRARHHGREKVLNDLRQKFWILNGRQAVKDSWNSCQTCKLWRSQPQVPEMGQLPYARVTTPERAFTFCGIDYFGPMEVTIGRRHEKRYGVLFTCLTTRAIHLEIAPSLTTDAAINAIRRMISRRGAPRQMYSDNGTNLRGADTELQKALDELDQTVILKELTPQRIEWHFIPPSAPHMGGAWERMVRSVKTSLRAVLKERAPKEDDLMTLMTEAENLVNSRPLTKISDDPDDEECLTPNHFLIGSSGVSTAPGTFTDRDLNFRNRWRYAQRLADQFWKRWIKEYLPTLNRRTKWLQDNEPIKLNDIVLIIDNNLPRNAWPKGRVIELHPGKDGRTRVVTIRTSTNILKRPVAKLCIIDSPDPVAHPDCNSKGEYMEKNRCSEDAEQRNDAERDN